MRKLLTRVVFMATMFALTAGPAAAINPTSSKDSSTVSSEVSFKDALAEFRSLSRKEKRERFKEVKQLLKEYKTAKKAGAEPSTNTLLLVILAILLPPLAVYLHEGTTNNKFWLSLILTLLFWVPGVIYALIVVLS